MTLVAWSHMTLKSLQAAEELAADGIDVEVIDLRTSRRWTSAACSTRFGGPAGW